MYFKRDIKLLFQRSILHFKSMGLLFWVPLAAVHLLIPLIVGLTYKKFGVSPEMVSNIIQYSLQLIPLCSCWWALFTLREYVEGKGNEILYVCRGKLKATDILLPFSLFFLSVILQYCVYIALVPSLAAELIRLFCVSFFYLGIVYFLMFLSKSTTITFMCVLAYTVVNFFANTNNAKTVFPLYFNLEAATKDTYFYVCLPMFLFGLILLLCGGYLNRHIHKFN